MHWSAGTACRDTYWVAIIMGVLSWQEVTRQMPQSCTFCKCCLVHSVHGHNMDGTDDKFDAVISESWFSLQLLLQDQEAYCGI